MDRKVSVLVTKCVGNASRGFSSYGERLVDEVLPSVEEATVLGNTKRGKGLSVIVRPHYNEVDDNGRFFREWRSFDGDEFKECRWACA